MNVSITLYAQYQTKDVYACLNSHLGMNTQYLAYKNLAASYPRKLSVRKSLILSPPLSLPFPLFFRHITFAHFKEQLHYIHGENKYIFLNQFWFGECN